MDNKLIQELILQRKNFKQILNYQGKKQILQKL